MTGITLEWYGDVIENYEYNKNNNRLLYIEGELREDEFEYNKRGDLTSRLGGYTYSYDEEGRLNKVRKDYGEEFEELRFLYTPQGKRVRKIYRKGEGMDVDADTTYYVYDGIYAKATLDGSYELKWKYIYSVGLLLGRINKKNNLFLYFHDGLGSIIDIHEEGRYVNLYLYDGFGKFIKSRENVPNSYHYTGQEKDGIPSSLYNLRTRYYDPGIGRFTQEDPVFKLSYSKEVAYCGEDSKFKQIVRYDPRNINKYVYCRNNPVRYIDIKGEQCGPGEFGDKLIPDRWPGFDFSEPCEKHDECYGTCGIPKFICDSQFLEDMEKECEKLSALNPLRYSCYHMAGLYGLATQTHWGYDAYNEAQKKACKCR